ncbi:hypothetical protein ABBQ38_011544 [Trebouxia sp. C0009 RCD-2024]
MAGLSGPTTQRALRTLQQTCRAAAKQADQEQLLWSYTPDSIPATDQEHTHLPQVLICNVQTLTAEASFGAAIDSLKAALEALLAKYVHYSSGVLRLEVSTHTSLHAHVSIGVCATTS